MSKVYQTRLVALPCARCAYMASARTHDKATDTLKDHIIAAHLSVLRQEASAKTSTDAV